MPNKTLKTISNKLWPFLVLLIIGSIAFFPFLGIVHLFDWDEINFAEIAREMLVTGDYSHVQVNFAPFYEKPPLFFWLQVLSMKVWGINEFAARFPNAIFGIITLITLFLIGKNYKDARFGLFWSLMHLSALLPHFYFKTGIIDPVFNYFMFLGMYCIICLINNTGTHIVCWVFIGGISLGLAFLTKGPIGLLLPSITFFIYWIKVRYKRVIHWQILALFVLMALLIPLLWFGYQTYHDGGTFIKAFLAYHLELFTKPVAGHGQPFYYHFIIIMLGCFPASVLALASFRNSRFIYNSELFPIMHILFWVVMVVFSLATTKIIHYSSIAYFPISLFAAYYLYRLEQRQIVLTRTIRVLFITVGALVGALLIALPIIAIYKEYIYIYIKDEFTLACMALSVPWSLVDCSVGISYLLLMSIAYYFLKKYTSLYFAVWSSITTTFCLTLGTILIVPKIEAHVQKPVIEFYKSLAYKPAYVSTLGFKSYAQFFYFQKPKANVLATKDIQWLLTGKLDRPAYFVVKINDILNIAPYSDIAFIKQEGGFVFYKREIN